jgi:small multidrug resistance pump
LRSIPIGITYAIWSGIGMVMITAFAYVFYQQKQDLPAMIGIGLIIAGVLVINLFSKTASHS